MKNKKEIEETEEIEVSLWEYIKYTIRNWWLFHISYAGGPKDRFIDFIRKWQNRLTFYIEPAKDLVASKMQANCGKLLTCKYNESYQRSRGENQIYLHSKVNMFGYVKIIEDYVVDEDGNKINKFLNFTVVGLVNPEEAKEKVNKVKQYKNTLYSGFIFTRKKAIKTYLKIVDKTPELIWDKINPYNSREDMNTYVYTLEKIIEELQYDKKTSIKELKKKIDYVVKDTKLLIDIRKKHNKRFEEKYRGK